MEKLLLSVSVTGLVFLFAALIGATLFRDRLKAKSRLDALSKEQIKSLAKKELLRQRQPAIKISTVLIEQLASAGVPMRAEEFLILWVVLALVPPAISFLLEAHMLIPPTLTLIGLCLPPLYVRYSRKKRLLAFEKQLADAIISISNCLKSGLTFQQGMQHVAEHMDEPISREFARVLREMQLGSTAERALTNLTRRVASTDVRLMVTAILIAQQVGGNLSAVLENIAQTVSDRLKVKAEIHTITSTGRISGMVIGFLPVVIGLVLMLMNPDYMQVFFTTHNGRMLLVLAAVLEFIGYAIIRKIVSIKY
ncbi:MAG TPA: type II secretion system F family protein [Clostridia bacterium]|nr:type II secretion system F family protein [Clostridia bacterium]